MLRFLAYDADALACLFDPRPDDPLGSTFRCEFAGHADLGRVRTAGPTDRGRDISQVELNGEVIRRFLRSVPPAQ